VKTVFVATGAYRAGKSTTLGHLAEAHGLLVADEAHTRILDDLGERRMGHDRHAPFASITDDAHFCPMCRPEAFSDLVVAEQRRIEAAAGPGTILDRGMIDPLEMRARRTGEDLRALISVTPPDVRYASVFVFDVMPGLMTPRWGRSEAERVEQAHSIRARLENAYREAGHRVVRVPPGTLAERAAVVLEHIERVTVPTR